MRYIHRLGRTDLPLLPAVALSDGNIRFNTTANTTHMLNCVCLVTWKAVAMPVVVKDAEMRYTRISAIDISEASLAQYSSCDSVEVIAHLAQSLLRGLAENLDLHDWLCSAIWPLEAAFQGNDEYVAAKLTMAEMLKSGTTTFLEPLLTHTTGFENVVRAIEESKFWSPSNAQKCTIDCASTVGVVTILASLSRLEKLVLRLG